VFIEKLVRFTCCVVAVSSGMLMAFSAGPVQGRTGNTIDGGLSCTACHRGADANDGLGRLVIDVGNYRPGEKQTIRVRLQHPSAARWGFQLTARVFSDQTKAAGTFAPNADVKVRCGLVGDDESPCSDRVEFAEHTLASTNAGTRDGRTWEFEWTPPATDVGAVVFYAAGNAANNSNTNIGDSIYLTSFVVGSAAGPRPTISTNGVGDAFTRGTTIASGSWFLINGQNFTTERLSWDSAVSNQNLPLQLSGVTVLLNNRAATMYSVSPTQIVAVAPDDDATGDVSVVVRTPGGESAPATLRKAAVAPALFAPSSDGTRQYLTAFSTDGVLLGKPGVDGSAVRAARAGETIQVFGSGFGPTNPAVAADRVVQGEPALVARPVIRIGTAEAAVTGAGTLVVPGLYRFLVTVPASADGDLPITAEIGGVTSSSTVFLSVGR
jgi:uncharacterized protein (TIGR03437 family)